MAESHGADSEPMNPTLGYLVAVLVMLAVLASVASAGIKNTALPLALLVLVSYAGYRWLLTDDWESVRQ